MATPARVLRQNARRGARLLDKLAPGRWFLPTRISLGRLDLEDCEECVSGQLRRNDHDLWEELRHAAGSEFEPEFGLDVPMPGWRNPGGHVFLQDEWEQQIRARRQEAT